MIDNVGKDLRLALEGMFVFLVKRGFRLEVNAYLDVLTALESGYGLGSRTELLWLCQALWARNEEEERFIEILFAHFPIPGQLIKANVEGELQPINVSQGPAIDRLESSLSDTGNPTESSLGLNFNTVNETGLGLPRVRIPHNIDSETFILSTRPIIPLRNLIVCWRRYRILSRTGPKTDIDISATILERCQKGFVEAPVFISSRRNTARLVVLIDVSQSMIAWKNFSSLLVASLSESKLGKVSVYYFHNIPNRLYLYENLLRPITIDKALKQNIESTTIIFSDAGAARGATNKFRVDNTQDALQQLSDKWKPIVWINPLPIQRWAGCSAEEIKNFSYLTMLPLNEDSLVETVDILRGARSKVKNQW